jgi:hypothetical protein
MDDYNSDDILSTLQSVERLLERIVTRLESLEEAVKVSGESICSQIMLWAPDSP